MPGMNADVRSPGGLVQKTAGIVPGDFRRSDYGTVIPPSIVPRSPDCTFVSARWNGLEQAAEPNAIDSNIRQAMRAHVEPDASPEIRR